MACGCQKKVNISGYSGQTDNWSIGQNNPMMNLGNNLVAFNGQFGNSTTSNITPAFAMNMFGGGQALQNLAVGNTSTNAGQNINNQNTYFHSEKSPIDIILMDIKQGLETILSDIEKIKL